MGKSLRGTITFRPESPGVACIGMAPKDMEISRTNAVFVFIGRCILTIAKSRKVCKGLKNEH